MRTRAPGSPPSSWPAPPTAGRRSRSRRSWSRGEGAGRRSSTTVASSAVGTGTAKNPARDTLGRDCARSNCGTPAVFARWDSGELGRSRRAASNEQLRGNECMLAFSSLDGLPHLVIDKGRCLSLNWEAGGHQKMADTKTEVTVYRGPERAGLTAPGEPITARNSRRSVKDERNLARRSSFRGWDDPVGQEAAERPAAHGGGRSHHRLRLHPPLGSEPSRRRRLAPPSGRLLA